MHHRQLSWCSKQSNLSLKSFHGAAGELHVCYRKIVYYFLKNGGEVKGVVTGKRQRSAVHMKGLEVPCIYKFAAHPTQIKTAAKLSKKADCILLTMLQSCGCSIKHDMSNY